MNKYLNSPEFFEARRLFALYQRHGTVLKINPSIERAMRSPRKKVFLEAAPGKHLSLPSQPERLTPKRLPYFSQELWKDLLGIYNNGSSHTSNVKGGTKTCGKKPLGVVAKQQVYITP